MRLMANCSIGRDIGYSYGAVPYANTGAGRPARQLDKLSFVLWQGVHKDISANINLITTVVDWRLFSVILPFLLTDYARRLIHDYLKT
jgi:hypothetical protein